VSERAISTFFLSRRCSASNTRKKCWVNRIDIQRVSHWPYHVQKFLGSSEASFEQHEFAPRGELCPLGGMFTLSFTPRGEHSILFRRMEGQTDYLTPRNNFNPRVQSSPMRDNFASPGQSLPLWHSRFSACAQQLLV
jgi:hypothetical protein